MKLREHRRGIRLLASGLSLVAFVTLALIGFALLSAEFPPPEPASSASPSPSSTALPALAPVVTATPFPALFGWLAVALAAGAIVRWLITDHRLERLRRRVGDATIVSDRRSEEELIIAASLTETGTNASQVDYLNVRQGSLTTAADDRLERMVTVDPPPAVRRWWMRRAAEPTGADRVKRVLNAATRAIVAPDTVFSRVTERRTLGDERAAVTLARTIEGDTGLEDLILVPVLRVRRGSVVGSMSIAVDGKPGRTLPMTASRGAVVSMLRQLVPAVAAGTSPADRGALLSFIVDVAQVVVSDVAISADRRQALLKRLDETVAGDQREVVRWLRSLAEIATATDIVFAVVPQGCRSTLKINVDFDEAYGEAVRGPVARARRFVGIGLTDVKIDMHRVAESDSYHLDVTAKESTYIEQADVVLPPAYREAPAPHTTATKSELIHVAPLRGDARAHVYWRDFRRRETDAAPGSEFTPVFRLRIRERPPGLLGPTFALSVWVAAITWIVGYFYPVLFAQAIPGGSAWATLILAAPALLTGLLLSRLTSDALRFMSISTFALIAWLSIDVAAVVTTAAFAMTGVRSVGVQWPPFGDIGHLDWAILMVVTGLHLAACGLLFLGRGQRYARTINERVGE